MKGYLYEIIAIATSVAVAIQMYFVALRMYGDPYTHRAEGASGICPIALDSNNDWYYNCTDEAQRQAAANVVAETFRSNAAGVAFLTMALCLALFWGLNRRLKRRPARAA